MKLSVENVFMKKCISFLLLLSGFGVLFGQNRPIGEWQSHASYYSVREIEAGNNRLFCASENGLFYLSNGVISELDKTDGLSDTGIGSLYYDQPSDLLVIGYESGTIDLVSESEIIAISTLSEADILSDKSIREIKKYGQQYYAASDVGIVLIDPVQEDIRDVYREIGPEGQAISALELEILEDSIFVLAESGILSASLNTNLFDFNNWSLLLSSDTFPITSFESHNNTLIGINSGSFFQIEAGSITLLSEFETGVQALSSSGKIFYLTTSDKIYSFENGQLTELLSGDFSDITEVEVFQEAFFLGSSTNGLLRISGDQQERIIPQGPISDNILKMNRTGNSLGVFYSSPEMDVYTENYDVYREGQWSNFTFEYPVLARIEYQNEGYLATGSGLYNENLENFVDEVTIDTVTDLAVNNGWLWVVGYGINTLQLFDGFDWFGYEPSVSGTTRPLRIFPSQGNVSWIIKGTEENNGIAVYEPILDQFRLINTADGLPSNTILDISIANSDEVWITTNRGLVAFFDGTLIFDEQNAEELFFQGGPLLQGQEINATEFDGGDRKWIATNNGLWLFNATLSEQLEHFTADNSPLPSNRILELTYLPDGQLFILTEKGLVSYQTASSEPLPVNGEVKVFPNPVSLSRDAEVGIKDLVANASLKITTPEGTLVEELQASGSAASWDLRDYRGARIGPGIYLIFSSDSRGEETFVGKIAIVK